MQLHILNYTITIDANFNHPILRNYNVLNGQFAKTLIFIYAFISKQMQGSLGDATHRLQRPKTHIT